MWRKRPMLLLIIAAIILYFFQLWRVSYNYSQSYRFGDEDAHMTGGYLLLTGKKAYQDFAANHQPLTYIFPAAVQKIFQPDNLYQFIARHRDAIFAYSLGWNILYLVAFGPLLFFFTAIFEIIRYVMLGNKILGEPLVVYPLVFLFGIAIKKTIFNKPLTIPEIILFSLSTFAATFSLLPIWPVIVIANGLLLFSNRHDKKQLFWQIAPFVALTISLFYFVPFRHYWQQTVVENFTYVIPNMNLDKLNFPADYLKIIFLPFTGIHTNANFVEILATGFLLIYAIMMYLTAKQKKLGRMLLILIALILTNNRMTSLKYGNFHALPWLGVYFGIPIVYLSLVIGKYVILERTASDAGTIESNKILSLFRRTSGLLQDDRVNNRKLITGMVLILIILILWLNFFSRSDYYGNILLNLRNDLAAEHHVNYTDSTKYGLAIKAISKPADRLIGLPNDTLVFWVSGANFATRPLESFDWQYDIPEYHREIETVFSVRPPEFYLANELQPLTSSNPVHKFIAENLAKKYVRISSTGHESSLYILKDKLPEITEKQWEEFQRLGFEKAEIK